MYAKTHTRKMQSDKHKLHSGSVICVFLRPVNRDSYNLYEPVTKGAPA